MLEINEEEEEEQILLSQIKLHNYYYSNHNLGNNLLYTWHINLILTKGSEKDYSLPSPVPRLSKLLSYFRI